MATGEVRRGACAQLLDASMSVWSTRLIRSARRMVVTAMPDASKPIATSTRVAATSATRNGTPGRTVGDMASIVR